MSDDQATDARAARAERVERLLQWPMLAVAVLVIPALLFQAQPAGSTLSEVGNALNWFIWLAFAAELVVMLALTPSRLAYLRSHKLDTFIVLFTAPFGPASLQSARLLRLLRLSRLLKLVVLLRRMFTPEGIKWAAIISASIVLLGSAAFVEAESAQHLRFSDGLWWSLSTVTTVGYGDIEPHTDLGRIIGMVVMLTGVGFVALLTAAGAQRFLDASRSAEQEIEQEQLDELQQVDERLARIEEQLAQLNERLGDEPKD